MKILAILLKFILILTFTNLEANQDFELWLLDFKKTAVKNVKDKAFLTNNLNPLSKLFGSRSIASEIECLIECKKQK